MMLVMLILQNEGMLGEQTENVAILLLEKKWKGRMTKKVCKYT